MRRILILLFLVLGTALQAQTVKIWEGTPVHAGSTLTAYLPQGEPKAAVVVCPGGSYFWLDKEGEGERVGEWLASEGFAAYVLLYRTGGWFNFTFHTRAVFGGNRHPDMIADLQRAITLVRQQFDGPVGAMGFSAGGHLVMSAAEFSGRISRASPAERPCARISWRPSIRSCPCAIPALTPVRGAACWAMEGPGTR